MTETLTAAKLIERFRAIRKARGITAQQLADATGIPRSVIANMESGRRTTLSVDEARTIAAALDVDLLDCLRAQPMTIAVEKTVV